MTRREQFVLVFIAGALRVGAAVVAANMARDNPPGVVPGDSNTANPPAAEQPEAESGPSEIDGSALLVEERKDLADTAVSVLGAVRRPGVYRLPAGSRVNDIIKAAGGANADADLSDINLAGTLIDGTTLTIPAKPGEAAGGRSRLHRGAVDTARFNPPEYSVSRWRENFGSAGPGSGAGQASAGIGAGGLININTATQDRLETLPGVGPVKAAAIIRYRSERQYTTTSDLMNVSGIGPKTFENIEPLVTVR